MRAELRNRRKVLSFGFRVSGFEFEVRSAECGVQSLDLCEQALNPELETRNPKLFFPVVLLEFPVKGFAADAERAGSVGFVALCVVECGLNCLPLDFFHG